MSTALRCAEESGKPATACASAARAAGGRRGRVPSSSSELKETSHLSVVPWAPLLEATLCGDLPPDAPFLNLAISMRVSNASHSPPPHPARVPKACLNSSLSLVFQVENRTPSIGHRNDNRFTLQSVSCKSGQLPCRVFWQISKRETRV